MTYPVNANRTFNASVALTITAGAYSANDVVGGLLSFAVADTNGASGIIRGLRLTDGDNEKAACKLWLFSSAPSTIADNAAFAPSVADLQKCLGYLTIAAADYTTVNSNALAVVDELSFDFSTANGTVYGYLVCDATPTYTATTDLPKLELYGYLL